jgi:hypothetical protein
MKTLSNSGSPNTDKEGISHFDSFVSFVWYFLCIYDI